MLFGKVSKVQIQIDEDKNQNIMKKFLDKRARIVLASGQNEPVSDTGAGKHSVFA